MSGNIHKDEAYDNIKRLLDRHKIPTTDGNGYETDSYGRIEKLIEQNKRLINTRPEPLDEWISVEDELPEDTGYFLAYDEFYDRIGIGEIDSNIQYFNGSDDCNVTHWMSLPEPPVNL
jgi:hypothetical protein